MLQGQPGGELLKLARQGCQVDPDTPAALPLASIAELLDRRARYARSAAPTPMARTMPA